jgi:ketosteroid isomerase-like protein
MPLLTLLLLLTATTPKAHAEPAEPTATTPHSHADTGETPSPASAPDRAAIEQVLNNYTTAVTNGDEALFMTILLDDQIPFFAAGDVATQPLALKSADTHAFAAFKRAVFHSNTRLHQTFDHVSIEQDKSLACVRLHFITRVVSSGAAAEGWKTLQLLKLGDQWKIAGEFYTVRSQRSNATPDKQDARTR